MVTGDPSKVSDNNHVITPAVVKEPWRMYCINPVNGLRALIWSKTSLNQTHAHVLITYGVQITGNATVFFSMASCQHHKTMHLYIAGPFWRLSADNQLIPHTSIAERTSMSWRHNGKAIICPILHPYHAVRMSNPFVYYFRFCSAFRWASYVIAGIALTRLLRKT